MARPDDSPRTPRPEDWQRLGVPVPRDWREVLEVTHGLLRPEGSDGQG